MEKRVGVTPHSFFYYLVFVDHQAMINSTLGTVTMANYFDVRTDSPTERKGNRAYIEAILEDMLPPLRLAARGCGYALAIHGSLARDIDMVAIPWTEDPTTKEDLVDALLGVISGYLGRATAQDWTKKPHGRHCILIYHAGHGAEIDLSVMPTIKGGNSN